MKPAYLIGGGVAALAALWSGAWWAGKVFYVEPQADAAVERLREGRLFFSFDRRTVSGFPFGYDVAYEGVALSDASVQWRWAADWLKLETGVADAGSLIITPVAESTLTVEATMFGGQTADPAAEFAIASEGLSAELSGIGGAGRIVVAAPALSLTQTAATFGLSDAAVEIASFALDMEIENGDYESDFSAGALSIAYSYSADGVTATRSRSAIEGVKVSLKTEELSDGDLSQLLDANGEAELRFAAASYEGEAETTGGPSQPPVFVGFGSGETSAVVDIRDGRARYEGGADATKVSFRVDAPGPFPGGAFAIGETKLSLTTPLRRREETDPYGMEFVLEDVTLDEAIWSLVDPLGRLDRAPMRLVAEVGGEARMLSDFSGAIPGQPPMDLETLEIDELRFEGLGVEAEAEGEFDIAGDASRPDGELEIRIEGALKLLDDLVEAGIVPPEALTAYQALIAQYAEVDADDDELKAKIESRNGLVSVNGQLIAR